MGNIIDWSPVALELGLDSSITEHERAIIQRSIVTAEAAVIHTLRYDPVQRTRTEYYPQQASAVRATGITWEDAPQGQMVARQLAGAAGDQLLLKHGPIRSITGLWIDYDGRFGTKPGAFGDGTQKTEGTDFWPSYDEAGCCNDCILHSYGLWPATPGSVKVTYVAGYTQAEMHSPTPIGGLSPSIIADSCVQEACRRAKRSFLQQKGTSGWQAGNIQSETLGSYSYSLGGTAASEQLVYGATVVSDETYINLRPFMNWALFL